MADVGLIAQAVTTAPEGYTIPGAQEIILKSIFAQYDGTGAAGNYVPTLQILAPNGAVVASCPVANAVTAGASVDVTWFPRGGVSTAVVAASGLPAAALNGTGINLGASPNLQQITFPNLNSHYAENDGGTYFTRSGSGIEVVSPGLYLVAGATSNTPDDTTIGTVVDPGDGTGKGTYQNGDLWINTRISLKALGSNIMPLVAQTQGLFAVRAEDITAGATAQLMTVTPSGWNSDNADHNLSIVRWGDLGTFPPDGFD